MPERPGMSSLNKRIVLGLGAAVVTLTAAACGGGSSAETTPPVGFTDQKEDYKFRGVIDIGKGNNLSFYTNKEPQLSVGGRMALLKAEDIYCPGWSYARQDDFNCRDFAQGPWSLVHADTIVVGPNPYYQAR